MSTRDADRGSNDGPVRFLRAMALANARKSLTGGDGVMVNPICASWNQVATWLRRVEMLLRLPESPRPPQRDTLD